MSSYVTQTKRVLMTDHDQLLVMHAYLVWCNVSLCDYL